MKKSRVFKTEVVLSLLTGVLICEFSDMQELAEFLSGNSVWTHQFACESFNKELSDALIHQYPQLASVDATGITRENWREFRDAQIRALGLSLEIMPMEQMPRSYGRAFTEPLKLIGTAKPKPSGLGG